MRKLVVLILILLSQNVLKAQLPDDLIRQRTVVVIGLQFNETGRLLTESDWLTSVANIHKKFRIMGVDVVTYLPAVTWSSNADVRNMMEKQFIERNVAYVITLSQAGSLYTLSIRPIKEKETIWDKSGESVDALLLALGRQIRQQEMELGNFLINDVPEVFTKIPTQKRKGFASFPVKLPAIRLGVPAHGEAQKDSLLAACMKEYPYSYEIIDYRNHEDAFREGYNYLLLQISATGEAIQRALDYDQRNSETAYVSHTTKGLQPIPKEALVHKYYLQHTVSKKIYVGNNWDADTSWPDALKNFVQSIRRETGPQQENR